MSLKAWILAGATATGKSAVCQLLAERMGVRVLSADSMLVYKGMDIGTAKPSVAERKDIPYFGIDLVTPDHPFSTGAWIDALRNSLKSVDLSPDKPLIVTGGTGLYIKAMTSGLDSDIANPETRRHWNTVLETSGVQALQNEIKKRMPESSTSLTEDTNPRHLIRALEHLDSSGCLPDNWKREDEPVIIALTMPREQLHARIRQRVETMFSQGLLNEVRTLKERYPVWSDTASRAIGYEEALAVLEETTTREEAIERICMRTRQLAKRQETWFRHQHNTLWCSIESGDCIEDVADKVLSLWNEHGPTKLKI